MKKTVTIAFICYHFFMNSANQIPPLTALQGTWYVNMSNFSMWTKGKKHHPTFTYSLEVKGTTKGLKDVVSYTKKGKTKQITGFDTPVNEEAKAFVWRGKGLLGLFKSKWEIVYQTEDWTLIHFQKTLATAEGYDVISKQKTLEPSMIEAVNAKLKELGIHQELCVIEQL